jgi:hypothetical protein
MYVSNVAGIIVNVYAPADFTCGIGDTISGDNGTGIRALLETRPIHGESHYHKFLANA